MRKTLLLLTTTLLAAIPLLGVAQTLPFAPTPTQVPPALNAPLQSGFKVEKSFIAASGLTGWVLQSPDGQYNVFFTTADGQSMIAGALVTSTGENLTQKYTELHVPKPDLAALWQKLERSAYVISGETKAPKSVVYALLDPNCVYCHFLWLALEPYEAVGLQVRWIPVGFLREDSAGKAAAILKGGDVALTAMEEKFGTDEAPAGIAITPDLKVKLDANLQLMREAGLNGTPGLLYKDAAGNVLKKDGMPMLNELPGITKLPVQPQTDPKLNRFK